MKQRRFEQTHQAEWDRYRQQLEILEGRARGTSGAAEVGDFPEAYRRLCHQHALARERGYSLPLVQRLNQLVLQGHRQLYRHHLPVLRPLREFIGGGFPAAVREQWRWNLASAVFFLGSMALMWVLVRLNPEMIYTLLDEAAVSHIESMYRPEGHPSGRSSLDDLAMFGYYIWNNIGIAFRTFGSGILLGVGVLVVETFNGAFFGGIAAHLVNLEYHEPFFTFVVAHGAPELTAIVLAGGSGLRLGWALLAPGPWPRMQALKQAAAQAMPVMYGVFGLLLLAAFIEAFWSPRLFEPWIKYSVGGTCWAVLYLWLALGGRR